MHILDLIMYFVTLIILWKLIDWFSDGEFTNEIGVLAGIIIELLWLVIYIILFALIDFNWIDIFHNIYNNINFTIKW